MNELIEDAIAMNAGGFEKRGIMIHRDISRDIPRISGDRTKLIRVFLNLFKNACEAFDVCERKTDRIIDISIESLNQSRIRVIISDNAIGFDSDQGKHIFEDGFSTKKRDSGMGLSQCQSIIESHKGEIRLESSGKNQGTQSIIELPV
jgi:signal transduction histidine kinase